MGFRPAMWWGPNPTLGGLSSLDTDSKNIILRGISKIHGPGPKARWRSTYEKRGGAAPSSIFMVASNYGSLHW